MWICPQCGKEINGQPPPPIRCRCDFVDYHPQYSLHPRDEPRHSSHPDDNPSNVHPSVVRRIMEVCKSCDLFPCLASNACRHEDAIIRQATVVCPQGHWSLSSLDVSENGFGDVVCACWLAASFPLLTLFAEGPRSDILALFNVKSSSIITQVSIRECFKTEVVDHCHPPRLLRWAQHLGLSGPLIRPTHSITLEEIKAARAKHGEPIVFCEGARTNWPSKIWPHWDSLESLMFDDCILRLDDSRTWRESAAIMLAAKMVIGIDSGPAHVAATLGVPTVVIYGPTTDGLFSHTPNVIGVSPDRRLAPCAGCWTGWGYDKSVCDAGCYAISTITPDDVLRVMEDATSRAAKFPVGDEAFRQARTAKLDEQNPLMNHHGYQVRRRFLKEDNVIVQDVGLQDCYRLASIELPEKAVVVDAGAHVGVFAKTCRDRFPTARIYCVEACPEQIPALQRNTNGRGAVINAALTYERDVAMENAIYPGTINTGSGRVVTARDLRHRVDTESLPTEPDSVEGGYWWADFRPLETVTLEDIMHRFDLDHIDLLKFDCEECEFSVLENTTSLDKISRIVGEYHGEERFNKLIASPRFAGWQVEIVRDGEIGLFDMRPNHR